ncbi:MAG: RHS repeat-associated core domain-containing protein, partial [Verrucomicrobiae bacterium]|nr:RHS repeat-associated core domain-containing protein [Verrucomicrobiae bacterium]
GYTDTNGTIVAQYEYDPFGNVSAQTGVMVDDFVYRFSTKYTDDEAGLVYYGYRFYNAELGRWMSRDPIGENGGLNIYCFVKNDPTRDIDYLGLSHHDYKDYPSPPQPEPIPGFPNCECTPDQSVAGRMIVRKWSKNETVTCYDSHGCPYEKVKTTKFKQDVAVQDGFISTRRGAPMPCELPNNSHCIIDRWPGPIQETVAGGCP